MTGIPLIGVLGLLMLAKRNRELSDIRPLVTQLVDSGYDLSRQVIEDACRSGTALRKLAKPDSLAVSEQTNPQLEHRWTQ